MNDHAAFFSFAFDDTQLSVLALFWASIMSWVVHSPMKHICVQLDSAHNAKPRYNNSRNKMLFGKCQGNLGLEVKQLLY